MKAITYTNTKTTIPNWVNTIHETQPRGYAYETDTHFIHLYGGDRGFNVISIGLTAMERKEGTLVDWVTKTFGATDINELKLDVGTSIEGVWRPSLYYYEDTYQALNVTSVDMRIAEQSLRLLIAKLDELFLYIEPSSTGLSTYSHKTRELLILASTELENSWKNYMNKAAVAPINGATYTTRDYVKLADKLCLREYAFNVRTYPDIPQVIPFSTWDAAFPTKSLPWYDSYNKTKHDRDRYFSEASLLNCVFAVVANLAIHCVRFSPFPMFEQNNAFSSLVNQHFEGALINSSSVTYYLHKMELPPDRRSDLFIFDPRAVGYTKPFNVMPFVL
jgi:hypothetical protein